MISMTFCEGVGRDQRKNPFNFSVDPDQGSDPGFFFFTFILTSLRIIYGS